MLVTHAVHGNAAVIDSLLQWCVMSESAARHCDSCCSSPKLLFSDVHHKEIAAVHLATSDNVNVHLHSSVANVCSLHMQQGTSKSHLPLGPANCGNISISQVVRGRAVNDLQVCASHSRKSACLSHLDRLNVCLKSELATVAGLEAFETLPDLHQEVQPG